MTHPRRLVGTALASALGLIALVAALPAASATPVERASQDPARIGLYGRQDPTFDGVYRQGLAILALDSAGAPVEPAAVRWLLRQQCGAGQWMSFRTDLTTKCGDEDSNATAMAVMALTAIGRDAPAREGAQWLRRHQQPNGGWEYTAGWGTDANSTGLAVQALISRGMTLPAVERGEGYLFTLQLICSSARNERGALDYQSQPQLAPDNFATAQATQALAQSPLPVPAKTVADGLPRLDCPDESGALTTWRSDKAAAGYLGRVIKANDGLIPSAFGGGADYGTTANAVLSMVAARVGAGQVSLAMTALESSVRDFVIDEKGRTVPGAAAALALAEHATSGTPRNVDGVNLIQRIQKSITPRG